MNYCAIDPYPTRSSTEPGLINRQDPVVYSEAEPPAPLNAEQIERYRDNGFLMVPNLFSADEIAALFEEMTQLEKDPELQGEGVVREPESGALRSMFRVHANSELIQRLSRDERLLNIARHILDDEVYIHQSRINYKPAFQGRDFQWHSDFETWHSEDGMPRMRALSMSLLLTENNEFNGPLQLIAGSHHAFVSCTGETPEDNYKQSLRHQTIGVPDELYLKLLTDRGSLAAPKGPAGSVLLFDCNTLHGSPSNISPYPRSNVFLVYNALSNAVEDPYCGRKPRPEFLATRKHIEALRPLPEERFLEFTERKAA